MESTLDSPPVSTLLRRLFDVENEQSEQLQTRGKHLRGYLAFDHALCEDLNDALLAVDPRVGRFLYTLVRTKRPDVVVEFGTSFGVSAIHIAAALRDNGHGRLITTEIQQDKVVAARANLAAAGLSDLVETRLGDARMTLRGLPAPIDMVLLDGWPNLYLPILRQLEPSLRAGSLVLADDLPPGGPMPPEPLGKFRRYVRDPGNGYTTIELPLGDGVEFSVRVAP
jgi:predicted O-methyltransferase YrrM